MAASIASRAIVADSSYRPGPVEDSRERAEEARPGRRRGLERRELHGAAVLGDRQLLVAERPVEVAEAPVEQCRDLRIGRLVDERLRLGGKLQGA